MPRCTSISCNLLTRRVGFRRRWLILLGGVFFAVMLSGCSDSPEETFSVEGIVTLDGQPINGGRVLFESVEVGPSGNRYTARGRIDSGGRYRLGTFSANDGAVAGRHRVMVLATQNAGDAAETVAPAVPFEYGCAETTPLTRDVQPRHNEIPIELHTETSPADSSR